MPTLNVKNRTLFIGDNLPVLRGINSESVDLIATDPPFNKGVRDFEGITKAGENVSYSDVWTWGDVQEEWTNTILRDHPALYSVIQAANASAGDDMGAFLCWLAVRVLECHRILKPTGSMYLHIDHTAHAYVKALMDAMFGRKNFRNEIVWAYRRWTAGSKDFQRMHDTILRYTKTDASVFNLQYEPYGDWIEKDYKYVDEETGKKWRWHTVKGKRYKVYLEDQDRGVKLNDVWTIPYLGSTAKERTGYPTQKPLALYERILKASSNEGDVVLDPFAGCATTCVAAERLGRHWIGIDVNEQARNVIQDRLQSEVRGSLDWDTIVKTPTEPPERTDGGDPAAPELRVVSRQRNAPRKPPREIRTELIRWQTMRCQGCGWRPHHEDYLQVDHVMPRSKGGKDVMENYTLLCDPCNRRKSNKLTLTELREANDKDGRIQDEEWADMAGWR